MASGSRIGCLSSFSMSITSRMMNIAWLRWVSVAPCIRIVASETSSRRLDTSFVTVHSCDVSLRVPFYVSCRKYLVIAFFTPRRRTIILNWLVHLLFARGEVVGGGKGASWRRIGRRYRLITCLSYFSYFYTMIPHSNKEK